MTKLDSDKRKRIPEHAFAFPKQHKEPLEDESHVRNAIARFDQVTGVTDNERDEAWDRIKKVAKKFNIEIHEKDWHDLGKNSHT
jgi:hypothetical protein